MDSIELSRQLLERFDRIQSGLGFRVCVVDDRQELMKFSDDTTLRYWQYQLNMLGNTDYYKKRIAVEKDKLEKQSQRKLLETFDVQLAVRILRQIREETAKMTLPGRNNPSGSDFRNYDDLSVPILRGLMWRIHGVDMEKNLAEIYVARSFADNWDGRGHPVLVTAPPGCRRNARGRAVCGKCGKSCAPGRWARHLKCWDEAFGNSLF